MKNVAVPRATIQRLALYVQVLRRLKGENPGQTVSSELLAREVGVRGAQVRKDLAYFGEFGKRGFGYVVDELHDHVCDVLGVDRVWKVALIGAGHLGQALLRHEALAEAGFRIVGLFDFDPEMIGKQFLGLAVQSAISMHEIVRKLRLEVGIIATPPDMAQKAALKLIQAGVRGIVNFAAAILQVPDDIYVEQVDFSQHFFATSFALSRFKQDGSWGYKKLILEAATDQPLRPYRRHLPIHGFRLP